jgi:hypothetical protein
VREQACTPSEREIWKPPSQTDRLERHAGVERTPLRWSACSSGRDLSLETNLDAQSRAQINEVKAGSKGLSHEPKHKNGGLNAHVDDVSHEDTT